MSSSAPPLRLCGGKRGRVAGQPRNAVSECMRKVAGWNNREDRARATAPALGSQWVRFKHAPHPLLHFVAPRPSESRGSRVQGGEGTGAHAGTVPLVPARSEDWAENTAICQCKVCRLPMLHMHARTSVRQIHSLCSQPSAACSACAFLRAASCQSSGSTTETHRTEQTESFPGSGGPLACWIWRERSKWMSAVLRQ